MSRTTSGNLKGSSKPALKSALRISTMPLVPSLMAAFDEPDDYGQGDELAEVLTVAQLRTMQISEFEDWLRVQTNRDKRPFQGEMGRPGKLGGHETWEDAGSWRHRRSTPRPRS
jgi:hypothetical protein